MYGVRLLEDLKIDPQQGVVRVSLVHYNTEEEVEGYAERRRMLELSMQASP